MLSRLLFALFLALLPIAAAADETGGADSFRAQESEVPQPGSDAQFDKRLPPVLPGEEIKDGNKTMKVWSSSGPVPVAEAPEPWGKSATPDPRLPNLGVIVDERRGR